MSQSSATVALQCEQWALRELGMKKNICALKKGSSGCENTGYWSSDSWSAYERNGSSEPRLLHLPMYRKVLNYLTCNTWFSLINNNIWCSVSLCFVAKLLYNLAPPLASLEQFSQGYLRCCLLGLSPKNFHQIKHNSQLFTNWATK